MDLEEWEYLSKDGFINQLHHQNRKAKRVIPNPSLQPNRLIDNEYLENFIDPHKESKIDPKGVSLSPNLVIHVPVEFDFHIPHSFKSEQEKETVSSQVFFKKLGNEFADMKLDSPKSTNRGLVPQIDLGKPQFEEKDEGLFDCNENYNDPDQKESENDENHGGLNIWKMGMTGIGALCSFGFVCATFFVIAIGTRRRENKNQDQKLCLQVYNDEKRMQQVVHHTTKMNDAISALKGIPLNRGHMSIGGFFDGV